VVFIGLSRSEGNQMMDLEEELSDAENIIQTMTITRSTLPLQDIGENIEIDSQEHFLSAVKASRATQSGEDSWRSTKRIRKPPRAKFQEDQDVIEEFPEDQYLEDPGIEDSTAQRSSRGRPDTKVPSQLLTILYSYELLNQSLSTTLLIHP